MLKKSLIAQLYSEKSPCCHLPNSVGQDSLLQSPSDPGGTVNQYQSQLMKGTCKGVPERGEAVWEVCTRNGVGLITVFCPNVFLFFPPHTALHTQITSLTLISRTESLPHRTHKISPGVQQ